MISNKINLHPGRIEEISSAAPHPLSAADDCPPHIRFRPPLVILTPRLLLRPATEADLSAIHKFLVQEETMKYMASPVSKNMADTERWWASRFVKDPITGEGGGEFIHLICLRDGEKEGEAIGTCGSRKAPHLGYSIGAGPKFWGKGYGSEAVSAVIGGICRTISNEKLRDWDKAYIRIEAENDNIGSIRVAEKAGGLKIGERVDKVNGKKARKNFRKEHFCHDPPEYISSHYLQRTYTVPASYPYQTIEMFSFRRAAFRAISSRAAQVKLSVQPRSITTVSPVFPRTTRFPILPLLQKRFASDESSERQSAFADQAEPEAPDTTSAESFNASDVQPVDATEVPLTEPIDPAAVPNRPRREFKEGLPNRKVYIGNLFFDVTEDDLRREFSRYGTITNVKMIYDSRGMSKGFAYVEFLDLTDAKSAIDGLHRQIFEGRRLVVAYATEKQSSQILGSRDKSQEKESSPPSRTLYVGNLDFGLSDQDIGKLFSSIKNITDVRLAIDRRTGAPRGFAHADFTDIESAEQGLKVLDGMSVAGRTLKVDFSQPSSRTRSNDNY